MDTPAPTRDALLAVSSGATADWNARRFDDFYRRFADDVVYHAPDGATLTGVAALRGQYDAALDWCPDLQVEVLLVVADAEARTLASLQREQGTAVDGTPFGFEGMAFYRFDARGLIVEAHEQVRALPG